MVTASYLSIMGATLSNNGTNPVTKKLSVATAVQTMSVMVSSGMYDYSGPTYRVGLPAKSGVGVG